MSWKVLVAGVLAIGLAAPALADPAGARPANLPAEVSIRATELGLVFADLEGKTLYTSDRSGDCAGWCAEEWRPLLAPDGFKPQGDWGVRQRIDGAYQITYKNRQVFRRIADAPGEAKGDGSRGIWRAALYVPPAPKYVAPSGIGVKWAKDTYVLTSAAGEPLRVFRTEASCGATCGPGFSVLPAPLAARGVGDWSTAISEDGQRHWVYKGQAVYAPAGAAEQPAVTDDWRTIKLGQG